VEGRRVGRVLVTAVPAQAVAHPEQPVGIEAAEEGTAPLG
jgi:hypothetical protein